MASGRNFQKRAAILSCLRSTGAHPSAEALHEALHADHPDISIATVYRNLALFREQGLVQCVGTVNGQDRFDGDVNEHVHLICSNCGAVLDLPQISVPDCSEAEQSTGCRIERVQLTLTGRCPRCVARDIKRAEDSGNHKNVN